MFLAVSYQPLLAYLTSELGIVEPITEPSTIVGLTLSVVHSRTPIGGLTAELIVEPTATAIPAALSAQVNPVLRLLTGPSLAHNVSHKGPSHKGPSHKGPSHKGPSRRDLSRKDHLNREVIAREFQTKTKIFAPLLAANRPPDNKVLHDNEPLLANNSRVFNLANRFHLIRSNTAEAVALAEVATTLEITIPVEVAEAATVAPPRTSAAPHAAVAVAAVAAKFFNFL